MPNDPQPSRPFPNLLYTYFRLLTDVPEEVFIPVILDDPFFAKKLLAKYLIAWLHTPAADPLPETV